MPPARQAPDAPHPVGARGPGSGVAQRAPPVRRALCVRRAGRTARHPSLASPAVPGRPYLLENLAGETTHAAALSYLVDDLASTHPLAIATGYVNLGGLHHLATV